MIGPEDAVLIPRRSAKTDYEVELAVVIGMTVGALVTGGASGIGLAIATVLAAEGAVVVALDLAAGGRRHCRTRSGT